MKAAVLSNKMEMEVKELSIPTPLEDEIIIKVKACGICGTDQHIYHGQPGSAAVDYPIVLGHELAGEVVEVGERVTKFKAGDRVSIDPNIYCGECAYCQSNRQHLCENLQAIGVTRDGGMGEYCAVPSANCYLISDEMSFEEGAMIEPLGCVLHGFSRINIQPGASVLVIGGGYIGLMMLQMAKVYGTFPIVISEPDQSKHKLALQLGADEAISPDQLDRNTEGFDIVIECVGRKESMEQAVKMAKKGGEILLFGVAAPDTKMEIHPFDIFSKELSIKGSFINPYTHEQAIALVERGKIQIKPLLSHHFKLEEVPNAMRDYRKMNVIKGIIQYT
ncbi:zinc-dependent alcohol dehydrogenase family protein [Lederbergia galactosidilytica]|uniref:Theronine dehydrogenase n=1 Tax=Lederbergia galactosidilytica TaxID=217031 RepID=A0A177ZKC3_9BACI|nr:zinc-dependent alcohol dehydrogenase family protein [Lederbergia galactosidilytica]KRG16463.1 theronine dehydrogenase [Virgibacillus soli]OAK67338.1 theronine dehydrogenase [Lederbergia galactosidilytica]